MPIRSGEANPASRIPTMLRIPAPWFISMLKDTDCNFRRIIAEAAKGFLSERETAILRLGTTGNDWLRQAISDRTLQPSRASGLRELGISVLREMPIRSMGCTLRRSFKLPPLPEPRTTFRNSPAPTPWGIRRFSTTERTWESVRRRPHTNWM